MIAHLITTTPPDLLPMTGRSPGVHVSDVIKYIKGYSTDPPDDIARGRMLLGKALEWAILSMYRRHTADDNTYCEPGELQLNDISGTLDLGRWWHTPARQVGEIKLRFGRPPPPPPDPIDDPAIDSPELSTYLQQLKSYCRMADTLRGRLIVCYVGGFADVHWRDWEIEFDQLELELNWAVMVSVANQLRSINNAQAKDP